MNCTSCHSVAASTAMLGMAKEAELMCEWMRENKTRIDFCYGPVPDVIIESRKIRYHTLYVMIKLREESSAAAGREEPASTSGPGCNGNSIASNGSAKTNGGCIPDVLNSQDQKINEDVKCKKGSMEGEDLFEKLGVWERLLPPYAFAGHSDYSNYLEKYYNHNGNGIATNGSANTNGGCIPDVLNSQDQKIKEDDKCNKGNMEGEDLFEKLRVWERLLLPYAFAGRSDYSNYLEKYYKHNVLGFVALGTANQNPEELLLDSASGAMQIATTASRYLAASVSISCLKMEEALVFESKPQGQHCEYGIPVDINIHSCLIKEHVLSICGTSWEVSIPSIIAFVCITKEAELMIELLKLGAVLTDEMIELSIVIRICSLGLASLKGRQSIAAAAAMAFLLSALIAK